MELLFVTLAGAIIGLAGRYVLPGRHTHGAALMPAIGVAVASILWVALTWAGLKWNGGWIWTITLVGTVALVVAVDVLLGRRRAHHDERLLHELSKGAPQPAR